KEQNKIQWSMVSGTPIFNSDGSVKLAMSIFKDFTERKNLEDSLRLLAESGELLDSSLDYPLTLQSIAKLIVPSLAEWCTIAIQESEEKNPRTLVVAHADPAKVIWAENLSKRYPPDWEASTGAGNVIRTGVSELYSEIPEELLIQGA